MIEPRYRLTPCTPPPSWSLHIGPLAHDTVCPHGLIEHHVNGEGATEACPICATEEPRR